MTDDEIIAVVQAHKEGKKIEVNLGFGWLPLSECQNMHYPNFQAGSFRVAPEPRKPREWTVYLLDDDKIVHALDRSLKLPRIRVREVIE